MKKYLPGEKETVSALITAYRSIFKRPTKQYGNNSPHKDLINLLNRKISEIRNAMIPSLKGNSKASFSDIRDIYGDLSVYRDYSNDNIFKANMTAAINWASQAQGKTSAINPNLSEIAANLKYCANTLEDVVSRLKAL